MVGDLENNKVADRRNGESGPFTIVCPAFRPRISSHLADDIPAVKTVKPLPGG